MKTKLLTLALLGAGFLAAAPRVSIGIGIGVGPRYYAPAPVYVAPAPTYYAPAPAYVAPAPAYAIPPSPGYGYVWVGGYWGPSHVWHQGYWARRGYEYRYRR